MTKGLEELVALIRSSGSSIEEVFNDLHHFSKRPPFATKPSGFQRFLDYCNALPRGIRAGGENERTIQRTYRYVALLKEGKSHPVALGTAWRMHPLARTGVGDDS